jgi:hypothetical protein
VCILSLVFASPPALLLIGPGLGLPMSSHQGDRRDSLRTRGRGPGTAPPSFSDTQNLWLTVLQDEEYNSIDWSCTANGDPLLCVAGSGRQIKVYTVKDKRLVTV